MIKLIQRATASSKDGAKGLVKGIIACVFQNIAFMLPAALLYYIVSATESHFTQQDRLFASD